MDKKTAEDFSSKEPNQNDASGYNWFHTGDVGLFTVDGSIRLVDRVKNLVKLKGGEYIATENMESNFSGNPYVNNINGGVMVHGDGDMDMAFALVQVNELNICIPNLNHKFV